MSSVTASTTPSWLLQEPVSLCPCGCIGKRQKANFIDKTIVGGSKLLRQSLFADDTAALPGVLQALDPRVKLVSAVALLVVTSLVRHVPVLLAVSALAALVAGLSKISVPFFLKRVWMFIPFFTGIVVLPATFSFITSGEIVVPLGHWFGHRVGLTRQGLTSAALLVTRVAASISIVLLVVLTTSWTRLVASLRSLGLPRLFVMVLAMAHRYVFYLLNTVTEMYEARKARTAQVEGSVASGRMFVAATAGSLFGKAHAMSDEVHQAMTARGYTGQARSLKAFRLRTADVLYALSCITACAVALGVDRALGR
jgi:cobalt/nickel transport system permease protein